MIARLAFFGIAVFWVVMNVLLWRSEYGALAGDTPVPPELVWRKILTAPDASSLSVYQNHERMGYCEFSTGVGQQMATLDEDKIPPEGLAKRAGYQVHLAGNIAIGDFTNRLKFDGRVLFRNAREWQDLHLKISSRTAVVEIASSMTNQLVRMKIADETGVVERDLTFDDLKKPATIIRAFTGNFGDAFLSFVDLPALPAGESVHNVTWDARRTRVRIGSESVPVYRLATTFLGHELTMNVSTLGEILRVNLPGGITASYDDFSRR